jgi:hypothetical protein
VIRLVETFLSVFLAAAVAQAQVTTPRVNVQVTGKRCGEFEAKELYLVINEDDLEASWVKLAPLGNCHWTVDLGDRTISTSVAKFSLRGSVARTDCQKAAPNENPPSANVEFACCVQGPFRNVRVKIEPPTIPVTYTRDVHPFADAGVPSVPCLERGTFTQGEGEIWNTQFSGEDVRFHFGPFHRKEAALGLLLNDVVVDNGALVLMRDGVVYRLIVQRAKGKSRSGPTISSNAISIDIKKLGELKLERAEFAVIK